MYLLMASVTEDLGSLIHQVEARYLPNHYQIQKQSGVTVIRKALRTDHELSS